MTIPDYYSIQPHAITVTVVGVGGTGSLLLSHLARINKTLISQGKKGLFVTCVDDDIVKEHNLGRQLFTENDIGRSKAAVCMERINRFYGTSWNAICERFNNTIVRYEYLPGNILISCVDKVESRQQINLFIQNSLLKIDDERYNNNYWIDTGNGRYTGQVIMGSFRQGLSNVVQLYPDMKKHENKSTAPSCSLAEAVMEQDLFINPLIALLAGNLVWNITQEKKLIWTSAFVNLKNIIPIRYKSYG